MAAKPPISAMPLLVVGVLPLVVEFLLLAVRCSAKSGGGRLILVDCGCRRDGDRGLEEGDSSMVLREASEL